MLKEVNNYLAENLLRVPLFDKKTNLFCVRYRCDKNLEWKRAYFENMDLACNFYLKKFDELQSLHMKNFVETLYQKNR